MRNFDRQKVISQTPNHSPLDHDFVKGASHLILEIGTGTGMHPLSLAKARPDSKIIAIEKTSERFGKFKRQYDRDKLSNLLPVHAHAVSWVAHNLGNVKFDEIYLLYPNPNPKPGDLNKRWHAMPFFGHLKSLLKPRGIIQLRTNEKFYAIEAFDYFQNTWGLETSFKSFELKDVDEFKTLFEKKYLERGQCCYEIIGQVN